MTEHEQRLADDKMRSEIAKMSAEIAKIAAETAKINNENRYYPLVVGSGATLAIIAVVKLFL